MKDFDYFFEKFKTELYKYAEMNHVLTTAELSIEEDDYIFAVNCKYDYNTEKELITYLDIHRAWFQFPDFEATLDEKYVSKIEEVFNQ